MSHEVMNQEIEAAVKWWGDVLRSHNPQHDNGDGMHNFFATMLTNAVDKPTDEQVALFETALRNLIRSEAIREGLGDSRRSVTLSVDYGPDQILDEALKAGDINPHLVPCKTVMWIEVDHVSVRRGYRAKREDLYMVRRAEMQFYEKGYDRFDYEDKDGVAVR